MSVSSSDEAFHSNASGCDDDHDVTQSVVIEWLGEPRQATHFDLELQRPTPYFVLHHEGEDTAPLFVKVLWTPLENQGLTKLAQRNREFALTEVTTIRRVHQHLPSEYRVLVGTIGAETERSDSAVALVMISGVVLSALPTDVEQVVFAAILYDVLQPLKVLHEVEGRVHADVCPNNIIVSRKTGVCQLIDYGETRAIAGRQQVCAGGSRGGYTIGFADPRLLDTDSVEAPDDRVDIYSLGKTFETLGANASCHGAVAEITAAMTDSRPEARPSAADLIALAIRIAGGEEGLALGRAALLQLVRRSE